MTVLLLMSGLFELILVGQRHFSTGDNGDYRENATYASGGRWGHARLYAFDINADGLELGFACFRVRPSRLPVAPLVVLLFGKLLC